MEEKKIAVITGGDGNLGRAVIQKFIAENFFAAATVTHDSAENNFSADVFEKAVVDLKDEAATEKFVENIISKHNKIDAAILTAGGFAMGKIADTAISDVQHQLALNFETAYNIARPIFLQMMKQNNGRIFFIGSKPGLHAKNGKGMIAYSLSKSLIFQLAELMNDEAKGKNVVVNVVVPSTIDTPQNRSAMPGADFNKWTKPEAIADVIYWHCTPAAAALRENIIKVYNYA